MFHQARPMTRDQLEQMILGAYALFLLTLLYLAINIHYYTTYGKAEYRVERTMYNLREIPRVDYTEVSSEEEEEYEEVSSEEEENPTPRNRRDKNPVSRILEEALH